MGPPISESGACCSEFWLVIGERENAADFQVWEAGSEGPTCQDGCNVSCS